MISQNASSVFYDFINLNPFDYIEIPDVIYQWPHGIRRVNGIENPFPGQTETNG